MYQGNVLISVLSIIMSAALALPAASKVYACEAAKQYFYPHVVRIS